MSSSATGDEPAEQRAAHTPPSLRGHCVLWPWFWAEVAERELNAFDGVYQRSAVLRGETDQCPQPGKGDEVVVAACLRSDGPHAAVTRAPPGARLLHWEPACRTGGPPAALGARLPHWGPACCTGGPPAALGARRTGGPPHWAPPDPGLSTS
ncbi:unnamed protein product [Gadus morhua 'NCC']